MLALAHNSTRQSIQFPSTSGSQSMDASGYLDSWSFNPGNLALTLNEPVFPVPADAANLRIGIFSHAISVASCGNRKNPVPFGTPNFAVLSTDRVDLVFRSLSSQCYTESRTKQASLSA